MKVAQLAPTANLNAQGWGGMNFMRLALDHDHPGHDVLTVLLRSGLDPDQSSSALYLLITNQKDEALLRLVVDAGVNLNHHMGRGGWYFFIRDDWPEGLALLLDHGADTEVQDTMGYTPLMRAARGREAGGPLKCCCRMARAPIMPATTDSTLRDLLSAAIASNRGEIPPRIERFRRACASARARPREAALHPRAATAMARGRALTRSCAGNPEAALARSAPLG